MSKLLDHGLPCKSCTSSDAMAEYDDGYYCFSCQEYFPKNKTSSRQQKDSENLLLPDDYSMVLPNKAVEYLSSLGLDIDDINKYKIGWTEECRIKSPRTGQWVKFGPRLILPYFENYKLLFFEGKSLKKNDNIKYVTIGGKKDLYKTYTKPPECVVIVEDILSAMVVGKSTPCIALRGTHVNIEKLLKLQQASEKYIIWLDGDEPGIKAAERLKTKLKWFSDVAVIKTERDPKWYSQKEISEIVKITANESF